MKAAVQLVQEEGTAALSVRNIARTLNCSTQPIYSEFEHMETLREELTAISGNIISVRMLAAISRSPSPFCPLRSGKRTCFSWSTCVIGLREKRSLRTQ